MKNEVMDAIKRSGAVPSMPQVVTRFMEIIQDPDFRYDDLVTVLSTDPGTASEILLLSNSALFGVSRKITSLKQAMTLLGPRRVRSLVLGRYMVEAIGSKEMGELDPTYYWRRSVTAGVVAARFTDILLPRMREEAFIASLLADIGLTLLAQEMPAQYKPVLELFRPHGGTDLAEVELEAVGVTHAEISAAVLEHLRLPEPICKAVAHHQNEITDNTEVGKLARIVSSADKISKILCESPEFDTLANHCRTAMEYITLDLSVLSGMLDDIEADVLELGDVLHLDIIPSSVYKLLARAIKEQLAAAANA